MSSLARTLTLSTTLEAHSASMPPISSLAPWRCSSCALGFAVLIFFTIKWETGNLTSVKPEDAVGLAKFMDLTFLAHIRCDGSLAKC